MRCGHAGRTARGPGTGLGPVLGLVLCLAACAGQPAGTATGSPETVGVILPDSASSARWETKDRPLLLSAFEDAGITAVIKNAGGDAERFRTLADEMISAGVTVMLIVSLDPTSGGSVIKKAAAAGVSVIDYDRLTVGGGADYHVSFDNVAVGRAMGDGLVTCLRKSGRTSGPVLELNGSPTDNNALLLRRGYHEVLTAAGYTVAGSRSVAGWDNTVAVSVFREMLAVAGGKVVGVVAANDGLAGAAVSVLRGRKLDREVPVTGQDATDEGLQRTLLGSQCVTVYKAIREEAGSAAELAVRLVRGDRSGADALASGTVTDPGTGGIVRSVLLEPRAIHAATVRDVIADGFTTQDRICTTAELQKACEVNGIG